VLADRLDQGALVLIIGTQALADEVTAVGLATTREHTPEVAAVVQGHSPDTGWRDLAEAALAIRNGALWVACNIDATLPTERGLLPGNGSMVTALRAATDAEPVVAGKPARPLMDQAIRSAGARKPLVVGDRLDTDILGATNAELDALLVLTGVATPAQVLQAEPELRPRYLSADLAGLLAPVSEVEIGKQPGWDVQVDADTLAVTGSGDPLALLRGLCAAWWQAGGGPVAVRAGDEASMTALAALNIG
jgi:ribonucleotide monophosphatase NagD (HAD superfamily)